ncbi:MAG TPA: DNA (cytosine-5-)-methyltransferase [Verrucomicrobiae bacterium]|nr:DNA (cytosine-5-)-methyltransferase [Verrucomicrobiae bacterium]
MFHSYGLGNSAQPERLFPKPSVPTTFTFIDLFAGIGGFRVALERLGGQCVFSSERDAFAQKTYKAWFGETPAGDIRDIKPTDIPDHDILAAGFPCQPFSIAGPQNGFKDRIQGIPFFYLAKIIEAKRPPAVFLENVKNLQTHNSGKTLKTIKNRLTKLGYAIFHKIYDGAHWVPQHRERIFIVAFNKRIFGDSPNFAFADPPENRPKLKDILEMKPAAKYASPLAVSARSHREAQEKWQWVRFWNCES